MLEIILDRHILYVLMGVAAACGIVSKFVVSVSLKRLIKAAGNMNKSTHPLMRLVRAKFEHACMISEKVENVRVFVDKYLYEYRVAGVKLHSLRRLEKASSSACFVLGIVGAALSYSVHGMQDEVIRIGALGAGLAIVVFLVHLMTDENYRMEAVRNYMVDYLENICLHRYEKNYQKEIKVMAPEVPIPEFGEVADRDIPERAPAGRGADRVPQERERPDSQTDVTEPVRPHPGREVPSPRTEPEITPPAMPDPYDVPDVEPPVLVSKRKKQESSGTVSAAEASKTERKEKSRDASSDVLIRQILEEFMA